MTTQIKNPAKTVTPPAKAKASNPVRALAKPAPKAITNPKARASTKPQAQPSNRPAAKSVATKAIVKDVKTKKPKMVRDSFTFPKDEYLVLDALKLRAAKLDTPVKKTELLRAGVKAIAAMTDAALLAALKAVPSLKTGRPAKAKAD
jgi:hypothetical protein